jgi:single-strand DNA-binding protein
MPSYDLTGTVRLVMDQQTFASGFTKREFVVTTEEERFPQDIKFECVKDKCALLDTVTAGQRVKVSFDLRGNEYNDRFYVNLAAWRIEQADASDAPDEEMPPIEEIDDIPIDGGPMPF